MGSLSDIVSNTIGGDKAADAGKKISSYDAIYGSPDAIAAAKQAPPESPVTQQAVQQLPQMQAPQQPMQASQQQMPQQQMPQQPMQASPMQASPMQASPMQQAAWKPKAMDYGSTDMAPEPKLTSGIAPGSEMAVMRDMNNPAVMQQFAFTNATQHGQDPDYQAPTAYTNNNPDSPTWQSGPEGVSSIDPNKMRPGEQGWDRPDLKNIYGKLPQGQYSLSDVAPGAPPEESITGDSKKAWRDAPIEAKARTKGHVSTDAEAGGKNANKHTAGQVIGSVMQGFAGKRGAAMVDSLKKGMDARLKKREANPHSAGRIDRTPVAPGRGTWKFIPSLPGEYGHDHMSPYDNSSAFESASRNGKESAKEPTKKKIDEKF